MARGVATRNRGHGLAAIIAISAAAYLSLEAATFLAPRACPRPLGARGLGARPPRRPAGARRRTARAARGGEGVAARPGVGDQVKAKSAEDNEWYPARIDTDNGDGTFVVRWDAPDDGPETEVVASAALRKVVVFQDYSLGDDVRAVSPDDGQWYPGVVSALIGDGTFEVTWDDPDGGEETAVLDPGLMRKANVFKDYRDGEDVYAKASDGVMYEAVVVSKGTDGTYKVKWGDPDGGPEEAYVSPKDMKYPPIPVDSLAVGQKYTGTVESIREYGAFVDIGCEAAGLLHISRISEEPIVHIDDYLEEHQEVDVWITGVRDDGSFGLTMVEGLTDENTRAGRGDVAAFVGLSPDEKHDGVVTSVADFGAFVNVTLASGASATGMIPLSQVKDDHVQRMQDEFQVGQKVKVRVTSADPAFDRMSLSTRDTFDNVREARLKAFEGTPHDKWLSGTVRDITQERAIVNVTAPDGVSSANGWLHVSQLSSTYSHHVLQHLQMGQEVSVRILALDPAAGSLVVTMRRDQRRAAPEQADFWAFEGVSQEQWLNGKVDRLTQTCSFITVTAPDGQSLATGVANGDQIRDGFVASVEAELEVGQDVRVRILSVNVEEGSMRLSLKAPESEQVPREQRILALQGVPQDQWLPGKVNRIESSGAMVIVPVLDGSSTAEGFVHISEIRQGFVQRIADELEVGQDVEVRILSVDVGQGRAYMSMKPMAKQLGKSVVGFSDVGPKQWLDGTVDSIAPFGAFIKVFAPDGQSSGRGLVHISQIREGFVDNVNDELEVGQDVKVRILSLRASAGTLKLSMLRGPGDTPSHVEDLSAFQSVLPDQWLNGKVDRIGKLGATITAIAPDGVSTGSGFLHMGEIRQGPIRSTAAELDVGQEVMVRILRLDADKGKMYFSMSRELTDELAQRPDLSMFEGVSPHQWLNGEVVRIERSGAKVRVAAPQGKGSARAFLPIGHIREGYVSSVAKELEIGQWVWVRLLALDAEAGAFSVSMKRAGNRRPPQEGQALSAFADIPPDTWLSGKVASFQRYGAFVTVLAPDGQNSADGLLHCSRMTPECVHGSRVALEVGQAVTVRVEEVDAEAGKMALSMLPEVDAAEVADVSAFQTMRLDQWLEGKVLRYAGRGFYANVSAPDGAGWAPGFVPASQIAARRAGESAEDAVEIGQVVRVRIRSVNVGRGELSLSMKPLMDRSRNVELPKDQWLDAKVLKINSDKRGAWVAVTTPDGHASCDAYLPASEVTGGYSVSGLGGDGPPLPPGLEIKVSLLQAAVPGHAAPTVSMLNWDASDVSAFQGVAPEQWLDGKVIDVKSFGATVSVPTPDGKDAVEGFLHVTQIRKGLSGSAKTELGPGDAVKVRVLSVDAQVGKLSLSMRPL